MSQDVMFINRHDALTKRRRVTPHCCVVPRFNPSGVYQPRRIAMNAARVSYFRVLHSCIMTTKGHSEALRCP